jgi:very-short-patch-repair endonuclease
MRKENTNYKERFMALSFKNHGNIFDYSLIPQKFNYKTWVTILCKKHGPFQQKARTHASGSICQQCSWELKHKNLYDKKRHTKEQFIKKAVKVHGIKYDYSLTVYIGQMKHLTIVCPFHGPLSIIANNHVHGTGCKLCHESKSERFISLLLEQYNISFEREKTIEGCYGPNQRTKKLLPFDFYLPTYNTLIEFDGTHHFRPVRFRGMTIEKANQVHERIKICDAVKNEFAILKGYNLIRIPYTMSKKEIENLIKSKFT